MRDPRTVRLKARVMDQTVDAKSGPFLISDMATLGGRPGLLGYSPGRFHDTDLLLTMLSYTFPLARLFELDLHSEWGGVYPDVWSDAKLSTLKRSIGLSLRGRAGVGMRGSIGVDFSPETARLHFSLGNIE